MKYYYFLIAYDSAKNASPKSELFSASFSNSANAQAKEFKMSVSVKKKYVSLKWANVKGNGTITYMVYRDDGSGSLLPVTGMLQAGKYKDIGNKKQCRYQVRAYSEEDGLIAVSETLEVK